MEIGALRGSALTELGQEREWDITLARLVTSGHEEARIALSALRGRHPQYLPQLWCEMLAG